MFYYVNFILIFIFYYFRYNMGLKKNKSEHSGGNPLKGIKKKERNKEN